MTAKNEILGVLGEQALLLPELVNAGLAANDRIKYLLTLLQSARANAQEPDPGAADLAAERQAARLDLAELDTVVHGSRLAGPGQIQIPMAGRIHELAVGCLRQMLAPLSASGDEAAKDFERRLDALSAAPPGLEHELVPASWIGELGSADRARGDSLHILVMDLHRELNRLQGLLASETIDGAAAYGLGDDDRPLVRAFMRGVAETAPLKFHHPGLGTTATRSGDTLVLQNDVGTTDAHVLVVHVRGLEVRVHYTDVHIQRAEFFQSLLETFEVTWDDTRSRRTRGLAEGDNWYLCVGTHAAADRAGLERFLAWLGSRIVFLIDWNRARKRLGFFVRKRDAVGLLRWAAQENLGHCGFLALGGEQLLFEAMEYSAKTPFRYGEKLSQMVGDEDAVDFLRFVIRTAATGLLAGRSERLLRDEVKAELLRLFHTAREGLVSLAGEHANLVFEIASAVRDMVVSGAGRGARGSELAAQAARWETQADRVLNHARDARRWSKEADAWVNVIGEADDAADALEEAAFLLTLLEPIERTEPLHRALVELGSLVVDASREWVRALACADDRSGEREDVQELLEVVDRIVTIEHRTDEADRAVTAALLRDARDFRQLHAYAETSRVLEETADALMRSALMLRDLILDEERVR